jgi:predicted short-subunit dehydrogenase-like oxidoreductase (DUF2520 family)
MTNKQPPTLNIIGAGRLGKTLGYLWQQTGQLRVQAICNRSMHSAQQAAGFIRGGQAYQDYARLPAADVWLLACGDDQLHDCCAQLCQQHHFNGQEILFHCSGALTAQEALAPAQTARLAIASIHPIKSFADPQQAIHSFSGTYCGMEGDPAALARLQPLFSALGAQLFPIKAGAKTLYHAASVIACNYLVALQELSIQTYAQAGVERAQAMQILQPIVQQTAENIFRLGTQGALTGPVARGDSRTVGKQLAAMQDWQAGYAEVYRLLGQVATQIAPHDADEQGMAHIKALLDKPA